MDTYDTSCQRYKMSRHSHTGWHLPPECAGQTIEDWYYIGDPDDLYRDRYDQATQSHTYHRVAWNAKLIAWADTGPWNCAPPAARWERCTTDDLPEKE